MSSFGFGRNFFGRPLLKSKKTRLKLLRVFGTPTRDHATSRRYERRGLCITFGHSRTLVFRVGVGDGRALAAAHPKDDSGGATDATVAAAAAVAVPAATSCRRETAPRGSSIRVKSPLW